MAVARKRWSPDEKRQVVAMAQEGYTQKQIADKLRPGITTAWRSVGEIIRDGRRSEEESIPITVLGSGITSTPAFSSSVFPPTSSTVELPPEMADSLTAKEFMTMMDDNQRAIFVATYEDLRGDADEAALSRAENDMLIRASYSNVKYLRAQSLLNQAEGYLMLEIEGQMPDNDVGKAKRRFAGGRESYKKECEQWQKEYMELLTSLKLTRKQRLDRIKDTRNTFLDLQQTLTDKLRKESLVEEIKLINQATNEEFHRMARGEKGPDGKTHSWLIGAFDEFLETPLDQPPTTTRTKKESDADQAE